MVTELLTKGSTITLSVAQPDLMECCVMQLPWVFPGLFEYDGTRDYTTSAGEGGFTLETSGEDDSRS